MQTHTERLAETPRRLQIGTSWSTLCRGVRDAAGEEEEVGEERRGSVYVREGGGLVLLESCRSCEEGYGLDGDVPEKAHAGKT